MGKARTSGYSWFVTRTQIDRRAMRGCRRFRTSPLLVLGMLCSFVLGARAAGTGASSQGSEASGRALYEYYCYQCHGYAGDGATLAAQFLQPPPRDFTRLRSAQRTRAAMIETVSNGRPGTGMKSFARVLDTRQRAAVVDYIRKTFMDGQRLRTGYHTPANGWPDHQRHAAAFPFATGEVALDARDLSASQLAGKRLFLSACVTCHEGRSQDSSTVWAARVVSYPRNPGTCSPCHQSAVHGTAPRDALHGAAASAASLTPRQQRGSQVFARNCAFCHADDGSGRNWIGTFLEPHARDLTQAPLRARLTPERLRHTILEGLPGTSMPAWQHVLSEDDLAALMDYLSARHQLPREQPQASPARSESAPPPLFWRRRH